MPFQIVLSDFHQQYDAIRAVRTEVFQVEQQIPPEVEYDDDDLTCLHVVCFEAAIPIGTARLDVDQDGRVGRVAVLKSFRRRGVGTLLMQTLEREAIARGLTRVWFHAQLSAIPFYQAIGYEAFGEVYLESDIPHRTMEKKL